MFKSVVTGCTYKVRQKITCEAEDVIYLVTCEKHNIRGVGCTTELKKRISSYRSHHNKRNMSYGITEHFLEEEHKLDEDSMIKPIVKHLNPPRTVKRPRENLKSIGRKAWRPMNPIT